MATAQGAITVAMVTAMVSTGMVIMGTDIMATAMDLVIVLGVTGRAGGGVTGPVTAVSSTTGVAMGFPRSLSLAESAFAEVPPP